jgi:anti-sigma28 factor (negative regulator of flagellin synthesis)
MWKIDEDVELKLGAAQHTDDHLVSAVLYTLNDRQSLLESLKRQIENDTYHPSAELIADSIVSRVAIDAVLGD